MKSQSVHRIIFVAGVAALLVTIGVGLVQSLRVDKRLPDLRPPSYFKDVEQLVEAEQYADAIDQLWLALSMQASDRDIRRLLNAVQMARDAKQLSPEQCDRYEIRALTKLLAINAQAHLSSEIFFRLGSAQLRSGKEHWQDARRNLERAVQLDPAAASPKANLARVLIRLNRLENAGQMLQAARSINPRLLIVKTAVKEYEDALKQ